MPPHASRKSDKPRDFSGSLSKLIAYGKPYYFKVILALVIVITSTIICIFGPRLIGNITNLLAEGLMSKLQGGSGIDFTAIGKLVALVLSIYGASALMDYIVNMIFVDVNTDISYRLRRDVASKINKLPLKYFDSQSHGDVLSRVTNDVDTVSSNLSSVLAQGVMAIVNIVGVLWMMFAISWKLTLLALIIVPSSGIIASFIVKKSQKYFIAQQRHLGEINGHVEEMYSGHIIVKTYNYEEKSVEKFEQINEELYQSNYKSQFFSAIMGPVTGFMGNLGYVAVCLVGGLEAIKGVMDIGDIQSFLTYVRRLNQPISSLAQLLNTVQLLVAAAERVFDILDQKEEVPECTNPVEIFDEKGECTIQGNVTFENVRFGYDSDQIIIKNFSMFVAPGKNVAIVGPTGAGKTTLVKLLMRFYELNGGTIYVDYKDIKDYRRSDLRDIYGMVLQDAWLFEGTILDNIRFSKPNATMQEVEDACKLAHVDRFIKTLPDGYNTMISEETSGISQGQKQLLTIARAFLSDPKILILDEATSSVDTRTEQLIQDSMERLRKGRTAFTIAHRLSTIKNSDIIIVLDKGDVVEVGDHNSLLEKKGFYYNLYNSQFDQ